MGKATVLCDVILLSSGNSTHGFHKHRIHNVSNTEGKRGMVEGGGGERG